MVLCKGLVAETMIIAKPQNWLELGFSIATHSLGIIAFGKTNRKVVNLSRIHDS